MFWDKRTIGETCKVGDGAHASISRRDSGFLYLTAKNFTKNGLNLEDVSYISKDDFLKYFNTNSKALTKPRCNDLLLGIIGAGLGVPFLVDSKIKEFGISSSVAIVRPNNEQIDSKYLYYWMTGPIFQKQLKNIQSGSAQGFLSLEMIRSLPVSFPPLPVQQKIASILSAYDALIENNNQRIALLEQMAEEIYKEWFVRLRFPGYQNTPIVDGLPEGWRNVKVRDCVEHYIGGGWGDDEPKGKNEFPAYVVRGTDIPDYRRGIINLEVLRYHSSSNLSNRVLKQEDIVFEVSGGTEDQSLGRTVFITSEILKRLDHPLICASFCKLIRIDKKFISAYYINSFLNNLYNSKELMVYQVQSTGICNYQFEEFLNSQFLLKPTEQILTKFDLIVKPLIEQIHLLGAKNENLKQARNLLLPRLISGKLNVEHLLEREILQEAE